MAPTPLTPEPAARPHVVRPPQPPPPPSPARGKLFAGLSLGAILFAIVFSFPLSLFYLFSLVGENIITGLNCLSILSSVLGVFFAQAAQREFARPRARSLPRWGAWALGALMSFAILVAAFTVPEILLFGFSLLLRVLGARNF
jgi:hypothetical protein